MPNKDLTGELRSLRRSMKVAQRLLRLVYTFMSQFETRHFYRAVNKISADHSEIASL